MKPANQYERIANHVRSSDLPRKEMKLAGLRRAETLSIPMALVCDPVSNIHMILVDGIAIDTSELENGYWL
jgi:hypothetical protein